MEKTVMVNGVVKGMVWKVAKDNFAAQKERKRVSTTRHGFTSIKDAEGFVKS